MNCIMVADEDYDIIFDYIKEKEVKNIYLSFIGGNSGENLDFLKEINFFEKIRIFFKNKINLEGLNSQRFLKFLYINGFDQNIDLENLNLETLYLSDLKKGIERLKMSKLKELYLGNLKNTNLEFLKESFNINILKLNNLGVSTTKYFSQIMKMNTYMC